MHISIKFILFVINAITYSYDLLMIIPTPEKIQ